MRYKVHTSTGKEATFYEPFDAVQWAATEVYIQDRRSKVEELSETGTATWANGIHWASIVRGSK